MGIQLPAGANTDDASALEDAIADATGASGATIVGTVTADDGSTQVVVQLVTDGGSSALDDAVQTLQAGGEALDALASSVGADAGTVTTVPVNTPSPDRRQENPTLLETFTSRSVSSDTCARDKSR